MASRPRSGSGKLPDPVKAANILIIALTANALKGDSEKYLAAGMNDYLAKPFDEERLFRVISRNLAKHPRPVVSGGAPAGPGGATNGIAESDLTQKNNNNSSMSSDQPKLYDLTMVQSAGQSVTKDLSKKWYLFLSRRFPRM